MSQSSRKGMVHLFAVLVNRQFLYNLSFISNFFEKKIFRKKKSSLSLFRKIRASIRVKKKTF